MPLRRLIEALRNGLCSLGCAGNLTGRRIDVRHHLAQLVNSEVDRVGNCPRHIFGNARLDRQIAVGQGSHFVQQTQNGFLVTLVLTFVFSSSNTRFVEEQVTQRCAEQQRKKSERRCEVKCKVCRVASAFIGVREIFGACHQWLGFHSNHFGCLLAGEQPGHGPQYLDKTLLRLLESGPQLSQCLSGLTIANGTDAERVAALQQTIHNVTERRCIFAEQERHVGIHFIADQRIGVLGDALGEHHQIVRECDFAATAGRKLSGQLLCKLQQTLIALVHVTYSL
ncbi:MAG: hypothetical protein BWZ07_02884 [Alphaproteobacteria bacterium ADurb.BinA280]|nr:MAG: hypothetical protein BWZ07_02884 [Alphaproteobacteria bacterium ADurb.BinA280]